MALVKNQSENRTLTDSESIANYLSTFGIDYEQWQPEHPVSPDATSDEILGAYSNEIEQLKARGSYITADVINIGPDTPGLDDMLNRFNREHWHDEDEVRFIISGHGVFHVHQGGAVIVIEVEAGDLIRIPRDTRHWFDLCSDRRIRAIRLFQDKAGWTPHYTNSGADQRVLPV